jgi:hypothetical protein
MNDSVFGEAPEQEHKPRLKLKWPLKPVNQIENELSAAEGEALSLAEHRAPVLFIEDDKFTNADAYGGLSARDAMTLQDIVRNEASEPYRRALIVARECGEHATLADYVTACAAEKISPLLERISKCQ